MDKPIFYCDCDGVILNTIEVAFAIMRKNGCNMSDRREVDLYFKRIIDWNEVFDKASFINNSVEILKKLKDEDIFEDIVILTKLSGGYDEERLKRDLFNEVLPGFRVVTLQYGLAKGLVVPAKGNVLLDDEIGNCKQWQQQDGVAILFAQYMRNLDEDIISDLSELKETNGVKNLIKTSNF